MSTHISPRIRAAVSTIIVALMIAGALAAPVHAAAQNQSVQSQLTGVNISYGAQYELQPDSTYEPNTLEFMMFLGPADILAVGFMSPLIDLNGARDIMLEGLFGEGVVSANIDRGNYTGVSYSLDMMNLDGSEMGVFTLFMNQRAHGYSEFYIFMAPPAYFGTAMQTAQNAFTIDGNPLMDGVDSTVMGDMVVANIGLTGGTAVTDVGDVTEKVDSPETSTTTTTTQTSQADAGAKAEYLEAVQAEYDLANQEWSSFLLTFKDFSDELISAEEASPIINGAMEVLAGASDRAAAIQPPAGMESFHQEYLNWAQSMTDIGVAWFAFVDQTGTSADHTQAMQDALPINESFGASLDAELASTDTGTDTPAGDSGNTTQSGTNDRQAYLDAVQAEYDTVDAELIVIFSTLDDMAAESITAQDARPIIDASHVVLSGTADRVAAIQPPAGMETFHQEFVSWSQSMSDMGDGWATAMSSGDTAGYNPLLTAAMNNHEAFGELLDAEMANTESVSDGGTEETADSGETSRTTRTTRSTDATGTEEATDSGETSRTTRTTRSTDATGTEEATDSGNTSRTTRTTRPAGDNQANTSETSGNQTSGRSSSSGDADYLAAVRAEYDLVNEQLDIIVGALEALSNEEITADEAFSTITEANGVLVGSETRIEDLEAPAGMESFHTEFLDWSASAVDTGAMWAQFMSQTAEAEDYTDALFTLIADTEAFGLLLEDEESGSGIDGNSIRSVSRELYAA